MQKMIKMSLLAVAVAVSMTACQKDEPKAPVADKVELKTFEQQIPKPNLDSVSPEFWKMVEIADWKQVIDSQKLHPTIDDDYKDLPIDPT